jgi:transcriptional regulator with XRE-family HTH domain
VVTALNDGLRFDLADYIRKLREDVLEQTQDEFAKGAGIGSSTLRNIETRNVTQPDIGTLQKIATYTSKPLANFLSYLEDTAAEIDTGQSANVSAFPVAAPSERKRRKEDQMSSQAWEIAHQYDRLPPLAQTAIDAIIRAFKQR